MKSLLQVPWGVAVCRHDQALLEGGLDTRLELSDVTFDAVDPCPALDSLHEPAFQAHTLHVTLIVR